MKRRFFACIFLIAPLYLVSCQTITPKMVADNMTLVTPQGVGPFPVVIYFQGTGGHNRRQEAWARWFKKYGVASAIVTLGFENAPRTHRVRNTLKTLPSLGIFSNGRH